MKKPAEDKLQWVHLGDAEIPLRIRRNAQARRMILRLDPDTGGALVTLPKRTSVRQAVALVEEKSDWLLARIAASLPHVAFADGAVIPYRGEDHIIRHRPKMSGTVRQEEGGLLVSGGPEHLPRRLTDWLKARAKEEIAPQARNMAAMIDRSVNRITVRDTKSRWGSCSPAGNLNFCWRLIMAPPWVLDYVVAHEVAHLRHMNHSKDFWRTVDSLNSQTKPARHWLNKNAERLQKLG